MKGFKNKLYLAKREISNWKKMEKIIQKAKIKVCGDGARGYCKV